MSERVVCKPMSTEELGALAGEQSDGYPMPTLDRINAALWHIAFELSRIADHAAKESAQ